MPTTCNPNTECCIAIPIPSVAKRSQLAGKNLYETVPQSQSDRPDSRAGCGHARSLPSAAEAATTEIQIGAQRGKPTFEPATVSIQAGDTLKWVNNLAAGSAWNVVFDQVSFDNYPTPADQRPELDDEMFAYLSHRELIKAPKQVVTKDFNVPPGEYTYACTPHESEGMVGKVIVEQG